ncbi:MAG: hypothetical protein CfP315_0453 [Candidatus Improbicoccus pseudotrichonymphae]|uniref:Uncharacterized protein n=1 Tax=Candidatus Improbicoccus pseudotrichonymphae TaxID=3033792 RepID=A0AA48HV12_9FIRM|nr:MAG: hypothetical protein CfP315_0453 [Candidatus Improbicoccus pseudotrichonymphae]
MSSNKKSSLLKNIGLVLSVLNMAPIGVSAEKPSNTSQVLSNKGSQLQAESKKGEKVLAKKVLAKQDTKSKQNQNGSNVKRVIIDKKNSVVDKGKEVILKSLGFMKKNKTDIGSLCLGTTSLASLFFCLRARKQRDNYADELSNQMRQTRKITDEKGKSEEKARSLENEKSELEAKVQELEDEKSELGVKVQGLEKEKSELGVKVKDLETVGDKEDELQAQLQNLENEKSELGAKVQDLENEKSELGVKVQNLENEKSELETKVRDLENEKSEKVGIGTEVPVIDVVVLECFTKYFKTKNKNMPESVLGPEVILSKEFLYNFNVEFNCVCSDRTLSSTDYGIFYQYSVVTNAKLEDGDKKIRLFEINIRKKTNIPGSKVIGFEMGGDHTDIAEFLKFGLTYDSSTDTFFVLKTKATGQNGSYEFNNEEAETVFKFLKKDIVERKVFGKNTNYAFNDNTRVLFFVPVQK